MALSDGHAPQCEGCMVIRPSAAGKGIWNFSHGEAVIGLRMRRHCAADRPKRPCAEDLGMRILAMTAAGACLLAMTIGAGANPALSAKTSRAEGQPAIVLAQAEHPKKGETVAHKVKRKVKSAWRHLTGYDFDVACISGHSTCTQTGKDRGVARSKCIEAHPFCMVNDTK
jgi:hypothetical protein